MIRYLLDTCVISDFVKGESGTLAKIQQTLPADIAISILTVMELRYGLALNPQRAQKIEPLITDFIDSVITLPFTNSEAQVRVILKAQGQPIGPYDLLIAATALQHNLIMVTANQREFSRVPNIKIENWRGPISRA